MSKRRTRQEKIAAANRISLTPVKEFATYRAPVIEIRETDSSNMGLPMKFVATDLTKTIAVTILALIFQFGIMYYLSHGGWNSIAETLKSFVSVY